MLLKVGKETVSLNPVAQETAVKHFLSLNVLMDYVSSDPVRQLTKPSIFAR